MRMVSEKSRSGNVVPFAKDLRLDTVRRLKRSILFFFVVSLFVCAYIYRNDLNINNLKRIASYINLGVFSSNSTPPRIPLDSGISNRFAVVGGGIAVLNRDTLKYFNAAGKTDMEVQLGYLRPAISSSDNLILSYDRGGNSICVATTYEVIFHKIMSSHVITASIGENGAFCVVTDEDGYRAAVTVFNSRQKEVYLWQTSEYFISAAELSPSGKKMAAAVFSGDGINIVSKIILFDMSEETAVVEFPQGGDAVLAIHFISETRLAVVTDTKTSVYDIADGPVHSVSYDKGSLSGFAFPDDRAALLAFDLRAVNQSIRLLMLDKNGEEASAATLRGEIRSICSSGRSCAVLATDKVYYFNRDLEAIRDPEQAHGAREIHMRDDDAAFLIFNNRAELSLPK